jgi:hypothetical protein
MFQAHRWLHEVLLTNVDVSSSLGVMLQGRYPVLAKDLKPGRYSQLEFFSIPDRTVADFEIRVFTPGICPLSVKIKSAIDRVQ